LISEDDHGFCLFNGELLLSRDRSRFVAGFLARPPPPTAMVDNTSPVDIEPSAAVAAAVAAVVGVALLWKI